MRAAGKHDAGRNFSDESEPRSECAAWRASCDRTLVVNFVELARSRGSGVKAPENAERMETETQPIKASTRFDDICATARIDRPMNLLSMTRLFATPYSAHIALALSGAEREAHSWTSIATPISEAAR